jgi:16S rRNA (cytosine1402-N4)-methyltransferase
VSGEGPAGDPAPRPHKRRPRYGGKNPRRFEDKYKERNPGLYPETVAKVLASGKTPAGTHRPIMVAEILEALRPKPGGTVVDCTLGYGGHAREILARIQPGGRLIGLDVDPVEQPRTEQRLRAEGFGPETLLVRRSNYAGIAKVLAEEGIEGADAVLADLGVSSMQLDDPSRGFSVKNEGPLDMRMNPERGKPAASWLAGVSPERLAAALAEHADEPRAEVLAAALAGRSFPTTTALNRAIREALPGVEAEEQELTVRRVFQAVRIAVNEEFSALEMFLRSLPLCLKPGGRAAILTFHSGEDRRVKKAFQAGLREGVYAAISEEVLRPSPQECHDNSRAKPAKLRWVVRA